jgi:uncharacterized protein with NRDE domain
MCLLVVAWRKHPHYRYAVAANRDEFHGRPAAALAPWSGAAAQGHARDATAAPILAGRDLEAGGTWLGLDAGRRFGIVTNFREPARREPGAPSRGALIPAYLAQPRDPHGFLDTLAPSAPSYAGFNLLLGDRDSLWYGSNRRDMFASPIAAGIHGLSNHFLDTPWPKLVRMKARFTDLLAAAPAGDAADPPAFAARLFDLLGDRRRVPLAELDSTGLPPDWEQALSAAFVQHDDYGTRCSSVLLVGHDGAVHFAERSFDATGRPTQFSEWRLKGGDWPAASLAASPTESSAGSTETVPGNRHAAGHSE